MAWRWSTRPQKQFLWLLLRRDSALSAGREVGLDVGCANMGNRRFFRTRRYIGVDPDAALLAEGKKQYPEAETVHATIAEAPALAGDFVQCIQVFVNADFPKQEAVSATRRLIAMTRAGGVLLMNTGQETRAYEAEIEALLRDAFDRVDAIAYGNFGFRKAPPPVSVPLGMLMYAVPALRTAGGHQKTYYRCVGRRADS